MTLKSARTAPGDFPGGFFQQQIPRIWVQEVGARGNAIFFSGAYINIYRQRHGGKIMKLTGELKKQVEKTDNMEATFVKEAG